MRNILVIVLSTSLFVGSPPLLAEEKTLWSRMRGEVGAVASKTGELGVNLIDASKLHAATATDFVTSKYSLTKDSVSLWSEERYADFSSEYPEIAANIDMFSAQVTGASEFVFEKSVDGALTAYEISANGVKSAITWTDDKVAGLPEITACGISELDTLGGIAIGTFGTALAAGSSTAATTSTIITVVPTTFGWMSTGAATITSIVSTPAVAVGVTAAALAGTTVYATSKGLCYWQNKSVENVDQSAYEATSEAKE